MQNAWYGRLAHVMEWGQTSRGCLPAAFVFLLYGMHLCWALLMLHIRGGDAVINRACFAVQFQVILAIMAGALLLFCFGLWLRRTHPSAVAFQYVTTLYYGLTLAWGGYLTGILNAATGVVLMGAPIVGFLLVERRVVIVAMIVAYIAVLALNIACAWHYLPYAPLLHAPRDRHSALLWTLSQILLVAPHLASSVAQAGLVLARWRQREAQALALSLTDVLTGVHNRRSILDILDRELTRTQRSGQPLSVVLLDLDHFKQINDRWGHPCGDRVLREAARCIAASIRPADALGRFGGEEFMLVLPQTRHDQAQHLVERCQEQLSQLVLHADSGELVPVRASFGMAWTGTDAGVISADALVRVADAALYEAKATGRNRLVVAGKPCETESTPGSRHTYQQRHPWHEWHRVRKWWTLLTAIQEWSPVAKATMVTGLSIFMGLNYWMWLFYVMHRADHAQLINMPVAGIMLRAAPAATLLALVGLFVGINLRRERPDSRLFQRIVLQIFGQTLIGIGYTFGILYMPTGVMLICSPLLGFLLFESRIVLEVFLASLSTVIVVAFACAMGWIPYAPLLSVNSTAWQITSPFWMFSNYFFTTWAMVVVLVLTDRVLGRWREREAEIMQLSQTDALTQVSNRRRIMEQLEKCLQQAARDKQPLTVVLLDLDHFKRINDTWGHPTGDRVLKTAAQVLIRLLRKGDEIGRYGGEEFMLLLRDTTDSGALALLERCRLVLASTAIPADSGQVVHISASFGIATTKGDGTISQLIAAADQALYRAKAEGRNRIEVASSLNREPAF